MVFSKNILIFLLVGLMIVSSASAATYTVGSGGTYSTIQACHDGVGSGDICLVQPGTYTETITITKPGISFVGESLHTALVIGNFDVRTAATNTRIEGFKITQTSASQTERPIYSSADNVKIYDNYIYDIWGPNLAIYIGPYSGNPQSSNGHIKGNKIVNVRRGMWVLGNNFVVENNEIDGLIGYNGQPCPANDNCEMDYMIFQGNNNIIRNNYFHGADPANIGDAHIDCFQTWDYAGSWTVHNNIIENNTCIDFGQFILWDNTKGEIQDMIIRNNVAAVYHGDMSWAAIYNKDTTGVIVEHNTIYGPWGTGVYFDDTGQSGSPQGNIRYNIMYDTGERAYWISNNCPTCDVGYNVYYQVSSDPIPNSNTNVVANPMFVDIQSQDFRLQEGSPACNIGGTYAGAFPCGSSTTCVDVDADGYDREEVACPTGNDCDDNNANVNPGMTEICDDGIDDDCDGTIDEGCGGTIDPDTNGDGCISLGEISSYVGLWLNGEVSLSEVSNAVSLWLAGCGDPVCGDGTCNGDESCSSCEQDCGSCSGFEKLTVYFAVDDGVNHEVENPIEHAYDGNYGTRWASNPVPLNIDFDLGAVQEIHEIKLSFYNWDGGRVYGYSVLASDDGLGWFTVVPLKDSSTIQWNVDSFTPVNARYVRLHTQTNSQSAWAGLYEAEIWGVHLNDPLGCTDNDGDGRGEGCILGSDCNDNDDTTWNILACTYDGNTCGSYQMCISSCPASPPEICDNQIDDDCDGQIDEFCGGTGGSGNGIDYLGDDRAIDWAPGISGGIPFYPVDKNVMDFGAVGNGVADDTQAIINAISAAPTGTAILLPAGNYRVTGKIRLSKGVVLRGEGVEETTVTCDFTNTHCIAIEYGYDPRVYTPLVSGYQKGSTQVEVQDISGFNVGDFVEFRQDNDPALMSGMETDRNVGQFTRITGISGSTLTIEKPLHFNYNPAMNPGARHLTMVEGAGLEDFRIEIPAETGSSYGNVAFIGAANSWMKNIWSHMTWKAHVYLKESYGNEIRDSVFQDAWMRGGGGHGYGLAHTSRSTDNLYENNIYWKLRHSMVIAYGVNGNVFSYSYSADPAAGDYSDQTQINYGWFYPDSSTHGNYVNMNLWEGNWFQNAGMDNVHGTNVMTTLFRNKITRVSEYVTDDREKLFPYVQVITNNYYHNIIGNELGLPGQQISGMSGRYEPQDSGTGSDIIWTDMDGAATNLVHGNYEYINGGYYLSAIHNGWEAALGGENAPVPDSLYLDSAPSWWPAGYDWPVYGPGKIGSGNILPAKDRFDQLRAQGKI